MAAKGLRIQRLVGLALGGAALALVFGLSAFAQGYRGGGGLFDNWFSPHGNTPDRPAPVVDYSRAPAPKKAETPPTSTVMVFGDSMSDWLAYGLEDALADTPELGVARKHRATSGLIRYDTRNENQEWAQVAREFITAERPAFIIMMLGLNDRQAIRERVAPTRGATPSTTPAAPAAAATPPATQAPNANTEEAEPQNQQQPAIVAPEPTSRTRVATTAHEFRSERWVELYTKRIDDTIAALKSRGVPVYWMGLPSIRGPKATSDMIFLNDLFRTRAEKAGIVYIDTWDGFVDDGGRFALQGPDFEGQIRRLRTGDGVHFTKAGARKLAHYVEREIRRASLRGPVQVALPATEPQQVQPTVRPGAPTARPLAGPVLPLTAAGSSASEDLLGGANARSATGHVTATRVLVKGEAVPPPAGRSDDFAWPRRGIGAFGSDPVVATTTLPLPVMQAPPAQTTVLAPTVETPATAIAARRPAAPRPQAQNQRSFSPFPSFFSW